MTLNAFFFDKKNIVLELQNLNLENAQKEQILKTIQELVEYRLLSLVLDRLELEDKKLFLEQLSNPWEESNIEFLRSRIKDIEIVLINEAKNLEEEIINDIKALKEGT